ncbi:MAG: hypothetical protein L3J76_00575 [Candidatus Hydrothermae bacterium]|nr:hypothetical protein [Candidatus Hydrothermae bacterium]
MIMPFLDLMKPYFIPIRVGNLPDTLTYLAAISLDDPSGSIDPGPYNTSATIKYHFSRIVNGDTIPDSISVTLRDRGAGYELQHFIKQVLFTYYDTTWNLNPDAKVVLVAHSMGGVVIAEALRQDPSLKPHIHNVITLGAPVKDLYISHPRYKPILVTAAHWNPALLLARPLISAMYSGLASSQLFSCFSAIAIAQGLQRLLHSSSLTDVLITVINGAIMLRSPDIRQLICSGNEHLITIGIATGLKEFMGGFAHGWLDFQQSIGRYLDIFGDLLYVLHLLFIYTPDGEKMTLNLINAFAETGIDYDQPATKDLWHSSSLRDAHNSSKPWQNVQWFEHFGKDFWNSTYTMIPGQPGKSLPWNRIRDQTRAVTYSSYALILASYLANPLNPYWAKLLAQGTLGILSLEFTIANMDLLIFTGDGVNIHKSTHSGVWHGELLVHDDFVLASLEHPPAISSVRLVVPSYDPHDSSVIVYDTVRISRNQLDTLVPSKGVDKISSPTYISL